MFGDKLKRLFKNNEIINEKRMNNNEIYNNENNNEKGNNINKTKEGNDKKKIENLIFFVVLLIITILVINFIWNDKKEINNKEITNNTSDSSKKLATTNSKTTEKIEGENNNIEYTEELENKLKNILSKIQGVGEVDVCLNYSESSEIIAMYNEDSSTNNIQETDDSGGIRNTEEITIKKEIVYEENDGVKTPITAKIIKPKIEGAIITAKGVTNSETKSNIIQAVEAITGLATHKIQVFEMSN